MAFTIRCIAGSSVGAPAPFRAWTAGRAVSLRKALALPVGSRRAAACASCAFANRVRYEVPRKVYSVFSTVFLLLLLLVVAVGCPAAGFG